MYVRDALDNRVVCPHPLEESTIRRITGLTWHEARSKGLIGHVTDCLCFECGEQCQLDLERDVKKCAKCNSLNLRSAAACLGSNCPRCKDTEFAEAHIGIS